MAEKIGIREASGQAFGSIELLAFLAIVRVELRKNPGAVEALRHSFLLGWIKIALLTVPLVILQWFAYLVISLVLHEIRITPPQSCCQNRVVPRISLPNILL